jgi:outer membrane lipoprotein SlyB
MRTIILGTAAAVMAVPAVTIPTVGATAEAQRYDRHAYSRYYDRRGYYHGPTWRGRDGRYYCRRSDGTTGLIIGGAAGALVGREIDGGRDRTAGTIIGAVVGGLVGREIDRGGRRCR